MSLPGGPSGKFGNLYELWWTVLQFLRMLHGKAESIRIEPPGVTKAEFVFGHRCLDLIDRMCLEGVHDVKAGLHQFER
jgi:hypothetical protein